MSKKIKKKRNKKYIERAKKSKSYALILVKCYECGENSYIRAEIDKTTLEVFDPDFNQVCKFCKKLVKLEKQ